MWARLFPAAAVLMMTGAAALLAHVAGDWLDAQSLALFFVIPVLVAAIRFGFPASLSAAILSALALNYLFVEPRFTFFVARSQDAAALTLFALVGAIASAIAAQARAAAIRARESARIAGHLENFATRLAVSADENAIAGAAVDVIGALTGEAAVLVNADGRVWGEPEDASLHDSARWVMGTKQSIAPGFDGPVSTTWKLWPVVFAGRCEMTVGALSSTPHLREHDRAIEQIALHVGVAMERARQASLAEAARAAAEREKMKSDLLAGVSHDLRTPLSTIVFTLQSLQRFPTAHDEATRLELIDLTLNEATRLSRMVSSFLAASRIEAGATPVRLENVRAPDLVVEAIAELPKEMRTGGIHVLMVEGLPLVRADPALAISALCNVLSNAIAHAPGTPIEVLARVEAEFVEVVIGDRGPGFGGDPERFFEKFVRGAEGDGRAPGLGLGLAIARAFMESQNGAVAAANRAGGGAEVRLRFVRAPEGGANGE